MILVENCMEFDGNSYCGKSQMTAGNQRIITISFSCSMGATRPASPSQHYIINRGLLVKSACFPTSSRLHPRVPSGCVLSYSTVVLTPSPSPSLAIEDVEIERCLRLPHGFVSQADRNKETFGSDAVKNSGGKGTRPR